MSGEEWTHELPVVMEDPMGMHARPAVRLVCRLVCGGFRARYGIVSKGREAVLSERVGIYSLVSRLVDLRIDGGEEVEVFSEGPDAEFVLTVFREELARERPTPDEDFTADLHAVAMTALREKVLRRTQRLRAG